ncbi:MAG: glycosyltransferase family 2 protein [Candidatus Bathyarchaeia archaeon]|jgi:glycosyltransferase involved in cell wall biosynthesis
MSAMTPRLSIGLPVYNGQKYLRQALDSILSQTFQDFELIISDNASTDSTQEICLEYASKDKRVRYNRNKRNLGAPRNYNITVELSSGEYFKWMAYDDLHSSDFLEKCIKILDTNPDVSLCFSKINVIDENGTITGNCDDRTLKRINSDKAHERFSDLISIRNNCFEIFGVMRAEWLKKTPLHGDYVGADRNLLAEMGLMGRFYEIPEYLFQRRDHADAYTRRFCQNKFAISVNNYSAQSSWWSKDKFTYFPNWKDFEEFFVSIRRVNLPYSEKIRCYNQIVTWFFSEGWQFLSGDIENLMVQRSLVARKLIPSVHAMLDSTLISLVRRARAL